MGLTIFSIFNAQSQTSVGLRAGVNFANFKVDTNDPDLYDAPFTDKIGTNIALLLNFQLGDTPLSLQVEPGYSQRGVKQNEEETYTTSGITYRSVNKFTLFANYIEVPVLLRFTPKIGPVEGIISLGPELRFLPSPMRYKLVSLAYAKGNLTSDNTESGPMEWDENEDPGKTDIGLVGGLGIAVPFEKLKLFAEGRYHYGAAFINKSSTAFGSGITIHEKISNKGISVSAGILYRIGH